MKNTFVLLVLCFTMIFNIIPFNFSSGNINPPPPTIGVVLKYSCVYTTYTNSFCVGHLTKYLRVIILDNLKINRVKIQYTKNNIVFIRWINRNNITVLKHIQ